MALADTLRSDTDAFFSTPWATRTGQVVPQTDDVALKNGAVELDAVVLYTDLAHSTELAQFSRLTAARIVRAFLSGTSKLIKQHGGEIRSFDGDRVMGVFLGDAKNSSAAKCALRINWFMSNVLKPKAIAKFPRLQKEGLELRHCTGVHGSSVLVVRAGVRGDNDLVFVGSAPNIAAKLSDQRDGYRSYITWSVHKMLNDEAEFSDGASMWKPAKVNLGSATWDCFGSTWTWGP